MSMRFRSRIVTPALMSGAGLLMSSPASAHHLMEGQTPTNSLEGFLSGLAHPVIGVDHLAFVLVVGLLAAALSGAPRYLVPGAFVAATLVGTVAHLGAANLPQTELVIATSVIVGGVLVLTRKALPALMLSMAVAAFGVFHGYAYGESIVGAETGPLAAYLLGFSVIQYSVTVGVALGMDLLGRRSRRVQPMIARTVGAVTALTGGVFLAMNMA